jgi:hypothetical protein
MRYFAEMFALHKISLEYRIFAQIRQKFITKRVKSDHKQVLFSACPREK